MKRYTIKNTVLPFLLLFFCLTLSKASVAATIDTLRSVKKTDILYWTFKVYNDVFYLQEQSDTATLFPILNRMEQIAEQRNSCEMKAAIAFLRGEVFLVMRQSQHPDCLRFFKEAANQTCSEVVATQASFYLGKVYSLNKNYATGFVYMLKADERAKRIGYHQFPMAFVMHISIGRELYYMSDYKTAISFLKRGLAFLSGNFEERIAAYETIGNCYRTLKEYDSANVYFFKGLAVAERFEHQAASGSLHGNIGSAFMDQHLYREALPHLYTGLELGLETKQTESAILAATRMADIYMALGNRDSAKYLLQYIKPYLNDASSVDPHEYNNVWVHWYRSLFDYTKYENDVQAIHHADSLYHYYTLSENDNNVNLAEDVSNKIKIEKQLSNIKILQIKTGHQHLVILFTAALVILILIIAWQKLTRMRIAQSYAQAEIENAKIQLDSYVKNIRDKNILLETAADEIIKIKKKQEVSLLDHETSETLDALRETTILTEGDWIDFKEMFGKVHGEFFIRLNSRFPELSNAEQRLIALSKLGLSITEKANTLGISPNSVRKTKQRLNKKTGLSEGEIIHEISL